MTLRGRVDSPEALGTMLQQGRMLRGLTQAQVAKDIGTTQKYVWELESGKHTVHIERLFRMMRDAGVTLYAEVDEPAGEEDDRA
jgi:HTH-type transcriptional regulator/antitoxin HipB